MRVLFHFECSNGVCKWISTKELVSFFMVESWILGVPTRKVGDCCARKVGSRLQEYLTCRGSILQQTWPWKFVTSMEKMCIKYYKTINAQETFGVFFLPSEISTELRVLVSAGRNHLDGSILRWYPAVFGQQQWPGAVFRFLASGIPLTFTSVYPQAWAPINSWIDPIHSKIKPWFVRVVFQ